MRLTHPDRVLYPGTGITKLRLAAYYAEVADWVLPHLVDRPLSIVRCPTGVGEECFFQKHCGPGTPKAIDRVEILEKRHVRQYAVIHDLAGLIGLVQIGCLEIHPWGSRIDQVDRPDRITFDLDPGEGTNWMSVVTAALKCRELLERYDLQSFVKTTGGKGLHVVLPISRRHDWREVKQFAKAIALRLVAEAPSAYTASPSKASRVGKIFIDYLRNDRGATAVAAYSTRARAGAPVSAPLAWRELSKPVRAVRFDVESVTARLATLRHDPWNEMPTVRQSITAAAKKDLAMGTASRR